MNSSGADAPERDVRRFRVKRALVYAFATACLGWVFHDVHPPELLATMSIANWWFVALAIIIDILICDFSSFTRSQAWEPADSRVVWLWPPSVRCAAGDSGFRRPLRLRLHTAGPIAAVGKSAWPTSARWRTPQCLRPAVGPSCDSTLPGRSGCGAGKARPCAKQLRPGCLRCFAFFSAAACPRWWAHAAPR